MLIRNTEKMFLEIAKTKNIICIGAGKFAKMFVDIYGMNINGEIVVLDNSIHKIGHLFKVKEKGVYIEEVTAIYKYSSDDYVVVIACKQYYEIVKQLRDMGCMHYDLLIYPFFKERAEMFYQQIRQCYSDYYYYNHMDLAYRDEFVEKNMAQIKGDDFVIPYLPIYLTSRCTLNCESCNNLMPYFGNKRTNYSWERTKVSLENILAVVKEMIFCELVGGEPFLYSDLEEVLDFVGSQNKIKQIIIVTNGTIIPNENVISKLKQYNVLVRISDYGMFDKMSQLVCRLEKENINIRILQDMKWNNPGGIKKRNKKVEEVYFQYNKCVFSLRCKYLLEDKMFTCARMASLYLLGETTAEKDVLEIKAEEGLKKQLSDFYLRDYGEACDYCDLCSIDKGEEIPAAKQVGKEYKRSSYTIIRNDELERLKKK